MTRQPAIYLRSHLPVTADAKPHLKVHGHQAIHGFNVPVAFDTIQTGPLDMGKVVEKDEVGEPEDPDPGDRPLRFEMLPLLLNLRVLGDDVGMAKETFLHGGNPRIPRSLRKGMTEPTVDLFDPGMHPVAEKDGLLRPQSRFRIIIQEIDHGGK